MRSSAKLVTTHRDVPAERRGRASRRTDLLVGGGGDAGPDRERGSEVVNFTADMDATPEQVEAGHAVYTKRFLRGYDLLVLRFLNRVVYRCPLARLVEHYDAHVSANHLEVAVGTGYLLERCRFPTETPRLGVMDINPNCLEVAQKRLARFGPEVYQANVLERIHLDAPRFDSAAMNYLLHCLPGDIRSKAVVVDHVKRLLNPGGVIFGATMLSGGIPVGAAARTMMKSLNKKGVMTNTQDDLDGLKSALSQHLSDVVVDVVGTAALFAGRT